jgi:hypothetical protein
MVERVLRWIHSAIETSVDRMKVEAAPVPLVAVGGGAFLVPRTVAGISEVVDVPHRAVANAIGAAIAQVSGEVDQIFSGCDRATAVLRATEVARERACRAGADESTLSVTEIEDLPIAYLPGDARRVRVRVAGDAAARRDRESVRTAVPGGH